MAALLGGDARTRCGKTLTLTLRNTYCHFFPRDLANVVLASPLLLLCTVILFDSYIKTYSVPLHGLSLLVVYFRLSFSISDYTITELDIASLSRPNINILR